MVLFGVYICVVVIVAIVVIIHTYMKKDMAKHGIEEEREKIVQALVAEKEM